MQETQGAWEKVPDEDAEIRALGDEIMRYLKTHPSAADTADGIVRFWIPRQRAAELTAKVQQALDYLVEQGQINEVELAGGQVIYSGSAGKTEEDRDLPVGC